MCIFLICIVIAFIFAIVSFVALLENESDMCVLFFIVAVVFATVGVVAFPEDSEEAAPPAEPAVIQVEPDPREGRDIKGVDWNTLRTD